MDIKLTLAAGSKIRSPTIDAEARWIEDNGPIYYGLPTKPKEAGPGSWVYFLRDGALRARARIDQMVSGDEMGERFTYTGAPIESAPWNQAVSKMELANRPIPQKGFQGYRYVSDLEASTFVTAFTKSRRATVRAQERSAYEGVVRRIVADVPIRNRALRQACRDHYGSECFVCGFDFLEVYGPIAEGFIHVHHLKPFKIGKGKRLTDAVKGLRPVCPNCHSVIHLCDPELSLLALAKIVRDNGKRTKR